MTEVMYAIRRADGEPLGDYTFMITEPNDWEVAELDCEYTDEPIVYEMVRMTLEVVERRALPRCSESGCTDIAEFWGLCELHAAEDDPETLEDIKRDRE